jgi:plastocyanin
MRVQEYEAPKLTLGVVGVIALIIPILLGYFLVSGMATSVSYTFPGAATSTVTSSASGPGSGVPVSIPVGSNAQGGAPGYSPDKIVVVTGVNSTVTWTNNDKSIHTVTADNQTAGSPIFDSGTLAAGASFSFNFTTPGTYTYHCNFHSWMSGTVVVVRGTPALKVSIPNGASNPSSAPGYTPAAITLVIGVNNTVVWTNHDSALHTVTSSSVPTGATSFDSGPIAAGTSFTFTFSVPGTYQYHCDYHSYMVGTVTVVQG